MKDYKVSLKRRVEVAENTMSFYFDKPEGFLYKAGQYMDVTLLNPPTSDIKGNERSFTLCSAPYEPDLMITTRIRDSAFKQNLKNLVVGTVVGITGPLGSFTLHNDVSKPAVFLAGGIGVTPFRSMVFQASHDQLAHRIFLLHSNPTPKQAAFLKEFKEMEMRNHFFTFIPSMTQVTQDEIWSGETGHFSASMLSKYVKDLFSVIYYIAGPPKMVSILLKVLSDAKIRSQNIQTEEFRGY